MNGSNSDRYEDLATAVARILRSICDFEMDGHPAFTHANSNDLDAPCDMLARLGLMKEHSVQHVFSRHWPLLQTAPLVRHAGEPSLNDLIRGLCLFVDWFPSVPRDAEPADVPTDFPDLGDRSQMDRFHKWSVQEGRRLLEELGIGAAAPSLCVHCFRFVATKRGFPPGRCPRSVGRRGRGRTDRPAAIGSS
jgi:hypothetical protein